MKKYQYVYLPFQYCPITTPHITLSYPPRSFKFPCDILYALIACIDINNFDVPNHNNLRLGTGCLFVGRNPASLATQITCSRIVRSGGTREGFGCSSVLIELLFSMG